MKTNYLFAVLVVFAMVCQFTSVATASTLELYAATFPNTSITNIDVATGSQTLVGQHGQPGISAMAYDSTTDQLLGVSGNTLFSIDRSTGLASTEVVFTSNPTLSGLAYDSDDHVLFAIDITTRELLQLSRLTSTVSVIGGFGMPMAEITYDSSTGTLYGVDNISNSLYTIDQATAQPTLVGELLNGSVVLEGVISVAYDSENDKLYGSDIGSIGIARDLVEIDRSTGAVTMIGGRGFGVNALAFAPEASVVPEPSAAFLIGAMAPFYMTLIQRRRED